MGRLSAALLGLALLGTPAAAHSPTGEAAGRARAFVEALDEAGRKAALMPFEAEARTDWHYTPRRRPGLRLDAMTEDQRRRFWALMTAALSEVGFAKVEGIITLERILGEMTGNLSYRDPGNYAVVFFGPVGTGQPWGWRFEGHHLSLSFTVAPGRDLAFSPAFYGTNPAAVPPDHPEHGGLRVLRAEHEFAFALLDSLDDGQRARAVIASETAGDIFSRPGRTLPFDAPEGLPFAAMTAAQQALLQDLVAAYVGNIGFEFAFRQTKRIEEAGWDKLHFAWAGSLTPDGAHYYRIHGPVTLIEYDASQAGGNHVHSVWRDPTDPFGEDLLRRHREEAHPPPHAHPVPR